MIRTSNTTYRTYTESYLRGQYTSIYRHELYARRLHYTKRIASRITETIIAIYYLYYFSVYIITCYHLQDYLETVG